MSVLLFTLLQHDQVHNGGGVLMNPDFIQQSYSPEKDSVFIQTMIPTEGA